MNTRDRKMLYHLTELSNLDTILEHGLVSRKLLLENNLLFEDVADSEIIKFRKEKNLEQYVPFHFYPYTPFDWVVQNNNKDKNFIYICIEKELAKSNKFKIIPKHPLSMNPFKLYEYEEGMNIINWSIMDKRDYKDIECKNVCMAECITELKIPHSCFQSIAVKNEKVKAIVNEKIKSYGKKIEFHIDPREQWFNK